MNKLLLLRLCLFLGTMGMATCCGVVIASDATAGNRVQGASHGERLTSVQDTEVRGTVTDTTGNPLPGVSVVIKGRTVGTATDVNGKYILDVPDDAILVFTMVGFQTQEIAVNGKSVIDVVLEGAEGHLDEAVVVAFGTQKKQSVIGSITTINPSELKVPSSNLTTALAGRLAGVIAFQRSGEPGQDNANFFVRGITTFGANQNPLILIDGIELTTTDLARLPPDDIASFSVMKDATATALYGSRAANGVILVTTKEGREGKARVQFRVEQSLSAPTRNVELADPVTYMKLHNEAILTRDPVGELLYSDEKIDNTVPGSGSLIFPATDWRSELFKDYTSNQRANLSVSGGGSVAKYYVSGNLTQDNGILKVDGRNNFNNNISLTTYNLRSNVNINLTKSTELIVRLSGSFDDYTGPLDGGTAIYRKAMRSNPVLFPATYPVDEDHRFVNHIMFGNFGEGNYLNPYADLVRGYRNYARSNVVAQFEIKQDLSFLLEGLAIRSMTNTTRYSFFDVRRQYAPFYYQLGSHDRRNNTYQVNIINPDGGTDYLTYEPGEKTIQSQFYIETAASYNRQFGKHGVSGMLVNILRNHLTANAATLQGSLPFRNFGLSGRATYAYDSRYFLELNFGYNGTERFYKDHRYGFFPAGGVAWSISNEKFFEPYRDVISNLRLRATYGIVGNDNIGSGRFLYLSEVNMNDPNYGAVFGMDNTYSRNGISVSRYSDENITWEMAKKTNFALELGLFNRMQLTAEYYTELRENILQTRVATPASMGLAAQPAANIGKAKGRGIDLALEYNHAMSNGAWLQGRGNFTYSTGKYLVYEEYDYVNEPWMSRVGHSINQQWGYIAESLFIDDYEVANSPRQNFGQYMAGDIKYRDINGDGQITTLDQVPLGYPTVPEIIYGMGFSAGFKNFDISAFFQGLARESFWIDPRATAPFINVRYQSEIDNGQLAGVNLQNQLLKAYAESHWSEDNRDIYAMWPRLSPVYYTNNGQNSTWFMRDGTFLRLKQVELGYSLPKRLIDRVNMTSLRIYLTGTNLLTWSRFKLWDVEMAGNGLGYPVQRVFNLGINASF
ncbi:SusC/RagA family TonB-linked outer membrane protein [Parapedobacter composti]|nr:TonB-dependent receptor [Parapedobacter composti]